MNLRAIVQVAGKELRYLAFSPIGWVVLAIFAVQVGSVFVFLVEQVYEGLAFGREPRSVARYIYTSSVRGVVSRVTDIIYLFIPLLTMSVFSRELNSGSIKLLMSSPLRPIEIVFGKFIAVAFFLLLFILIIALTLPIALLIAPEFDLLGTIPGILGIYLLSCTYAAIGIFVSSLTKHQIVAAIATLAVLFALSSIASWFREVPVFNEIAHWLSLSGRANVFREGLISSNHLVYFVAITLLFLIFTIFRISNLRDGDYPIVVAGKIGGVVAIVVAVGWSLSLPQITVYLDTTYDRRNSLSPESVAIMDSIEGPWEIHTYANLFGPFGRLGTPSESIIDRMRFRAYMHENHQLSMTYDLYYDLTANPRFAEQNVGRSEEDVANQLVRRLRINPESIQSSDELESASGIDLSVEDYRTFRVFRWNGREARTRFFDDARRFPQERTRAAALKQLVEGPVQIDMLVSNGERQPSRARPTDYRRDFTHLTNRWALTNHGFVINEIAAVDWLGENTDILVIADPRTPYAQEVIDRIEDYLEGGGDLVLLLEQDSAQSVEIILARLGLVRGDALTQVHEEGYSETLILGFSNSEVLTGYTGANSITVGLDGAIELLPMSDQDEFVRSPIVTAPDALRTNDEATQGGGSQPPVVGYALERLINGERQRVLVFGDADLFSTAHRDRRDPITSNGHLDAFHYLTEGQYPVQRTRRDTIDVTLNIERGAIDVMRWLLVGGLPLSILLTGGWILMRRRRQ